MCVYSCVLSIQFVYSFSLSLFLRSELNDLLSPFPSPHFPLSSPHPPLSPSSPLLTFPPPLPHSSPLYLPLPPLTSNPPSIPGNNLHHAQRREGIRGGKSPEGNRARDHTPRRVRPVGGGGDHGAASRPRQRASHLQAAPRRLQDRCEFVMR